MVSSSGAKGGIGLFFGMAIGSVGIDQVTGVNRLMFDYLHEPNTDVMKVAIMVQ